MYGLINRDQFTKRQSRWVKDIDETVRSSPGQRALQQGATKSTEPIISLMNDPQYWGSESESKGDNNKISRSNPSINNELTQLKEQYTRLHERLLILEEKFSQFSQMCQPNDSDFSILTEAEYQYTAPRRFTPFFIKESHVGKDNITILSGCHMKLTVEIIGFFNEAPIIYPFGKETNIGKFSEININMSFTNVDRTINGNIYGIFKRQPNNIYTIQITNIYDNGEASSIEQYTLPLILECEVNLIAE